LFLGFDPPAIWLDSFLGLQRFLESELAHYFQVVEHEPPIPLLVEQTLIV
jgi:hypothetical protein